MKDGGRGVVAAVPRLGRAAWRPPLSRQRPGRARGSNWSARHFDRHCEAVYRGGDGLNRLHLRLGPGRCRMFGVAESVRLGQQLVSGS